MSESPIVPDANPSLPSSSSTPSSTSNKFPSHGAGKPEWYTWKRLLSCTLGTGSYEECMQYVYMNSLKHSKVKCERCNDNKQWLFTYSPITIFMRERIRALGSEVRLEDIDCRICDSLDPNDRKEGSYKQENGVKKIEICANHLRDKSHMEDVVAHEMVHWYDYMKFNVDKNNLKHQACTEIRASLLSGECRWIREFWARGNYTKFTMQFQHCVRNRAVMSLKMRQDVKDEEHATKVVNSVWDSCFADTRPFDEIYR